MATRRTPDPYGEDYMDTEGMWDDPYGEAYVPPESGPTWEAEGAPESTPPPPKFTPISGYDLGKLSDPSHVGPGKYNPDVKLFSQALGALNYGPGSGFYPSGATLTEIEKWINANGGKVTRKGDKFDFGGGNVVDVATDFRDEGNPNSQFSFQDPRGRAPAAPGGVGGGAGTQNPMIAAGASQGGGYQLDIPQLPDFSTYLGVGPSTQAGNGQTDWQNKGFQDLFTSSMETLKNPVGSAQFESIRQPIDKARRTATNAASAALADRGTLMGGGDIGNAIGRIEERLAPDFASAAQRASVENAGQARESAFSALSGGNQYKAITGDLALRQLDQNRQWNQFLGDFGLRREQVQELLSQGRVDQLLKYYDIWNNATQTSAGGQIL